MLKMETADNKLSRKALPAGSALILTVVLTSLLAIVGVLFVMVSRVDRMATSAISENQELNLAIDTIVAKISQELTLDVPGMAGQEYYDYPNHSFYVGPDGQPYTFDDQVIDPGPDLILGTADDGEFYYTVMDNIWLADLEPRLVNVTKAPARDTADIDIGQYGFGHISDIYGRLAYMFQESYDFSSGELLYWDSDGDRISFRNLRATIIEPSESINKEGDKADADGDGVADSRWVIIPDMNSGKGKPIYAAVRIIDNGAMLNVNTGFKFLPVLDPNYPQKTMLDIGGPGQLQVNLVALAGRPGIPPTLPEEMSLLIERGNYDPNVTLLENLRRYEENVVWNYDQADWPYMTFDISDELELRNRFLLNQNDIGQRIDTRVERFGWTGSFIFRNLEVPVSPGGSGSTIGDWLRHADVSIDPNFYDYRHIATTCNVDRIVNPAGSVFNGGKMVNVNKADKNLLFEAIRAGLMSTTSGQVGYDPNRLAAQLAVNLVDLRDDSSSDPNMDVTVLPVGTRTYYGFETQPFISDIAFRISNTNSNISTNNHFAIELYNPFDADIPLSNFRLEIREPNSSTVVGTINLDGYGISDGSGFVVTNGMAASSAFGVTGIMSSGGGKEDPALVLATYDPVQGSDPPEYVLRQRYDVYLIRKTSAGDIYLDKQQTQNDWFDWDAVKNVQQFYARADNDWNVIYQDMVSSNNKLSSTNGLSGTRKNYNLYNFANAEERFASVGDIARAFIIGPSTDPNDMIGVRLDREPAEELVRLDLQNPIYADIFHYLTVIDPTEHIDPTQYIDPNDFLNETRIKGRVNINTAPWFVIAQLPWITDPLLLPDDPNRYNLAKAIVAYRDRLALVSNVVDYSQGRGIGMVDLTPNSTFLPKQVREEPGFASITELLNVTHALANEIDPNAANVPYDYSYDIRKYGRDKELGKDKDQLVLPDLTPGDGAENDFEERDLIFSRISNIVTVRSDIFTAYILVRIGADGPQKRVMAILDRSRVTSPNDKVRILALHPIPDPR
jgi:hypothetical protein